MCDIDTDDEKKEECVRFLESYLVKKPDENFKGLVSTVNM